MPLPQDEVVSLSVGGSSLEWETREKLDHLFFLLRV